MATFAGGTLRVTPPRSYDAQLAAERAAQGRRLRDLTGTA